jgi:hypothetical protein
MGIAHSMVFCMLTKASFPELFFSACVMNLTKHGPTSTTGTSPEMPAQYLGSLFSSGCWDDYLPLPRQVMWSGKQPCAT